MAKHLISNLTDVSSSLASHLISAVAKERNLFFSPLSIHVVLGLIAAGSGGPTRDQMLTYFKSNSVKELNKLLSKHANVLLADGGPLGGPKFSTANGMWVDRSLTLKPNFKGIVENDYKAACKHVDFRTKAEKARQEVNTWATEKTNGLINDILPPGSVSYLTSLVFANAIYFKGVWEDPFESSLTKDHEFYLTNGTSVKVPFMTSYRRQLVRAFRGFKVLTLPYEQGRDRRRRFSMHIFLPDAKDGLPSLVEKFGTEVDFINNHLPREYVKVRKFRVPKFKMDFEVEASKVLQDHGLVLPFRMGGLTEMVDSAVVSEELEVSAIYQKAFIEVNEEGTEAVAATVGSGMAGCARHRVKEQEFDFVADHPFMFVVREDVSGVVIFIGQLTNPEKGK